MIAVFLMLAGIAVVGFVVSCFIKKITIENEEFGRQRLEAPEQSGDLPRRLDPVDFGLVILC